MGLLYYFTNKNYLFNEIVQIQKEAQRDGKALTIMYNFPDKNFLKDYNGENDMIVIDDNPETKLGVSKYIKDFLCEHKIPFIMRKFEKHNNDTHISQIHYTFTSDIKEAISEEDKARILTWWQRLPTNIQLKYLEKYTIRSGISRDTQVIPHNLVYVEIQPIGDFKIDFIDEDDLVKKVIEHDLINEYEKNDRILEWWSKLSYNRKVFICKEFNIPYNEIHMDTHKRDIPRVEVNLNTLKDTIYKCSVVDREEIYKWWNCIPKDLKIGILLKYNIGLDMLDEKFPWKIMYIENHGNTLCDVIIKDDLMCRNLSYLSITYIFKKYIDELKKKNHG